MKKRLLLMIAVLLTALNLNAQNPNVVSITGEAAGDWSIDLDMTSADGVNWTYTGLIVADANSPKPNEGGIKFRANHDWATNWGAAEFPTGTGLQNGINIQCKAGTYDVTFNSTTGEYNFIKGAAIPVVKLVGTASSDPAGVSMSTFNGTNYTVSNVTLLAGNAQFSADGVLAGATSFPTGTVIDATSNIPVTAGKYTSITYDLNTGEYVFVKAPVFNVVSLIGIAALGWGTDIDMTTTDGVNYTLKNVTLVAVDPNIKDSGKIKFRQNHNWTETSFGDSSFPSGTSTGSDILVTTSGVYNVSFNLTTGVYNFTFPVVSIIGVGAIDWATDIDMTTNDGISYTLASIDLKAVDATVKDSGEIKFRQNHNWNDDASFGDVAFPSGTATATGSNLKVTTTGTYSVAFNLSTGAYVFTNKSLGLNKLDAKSFSVYPNPSQGAWNITSKNNNIKSVQVYDINGRAVRNTTTTTVDGTTLAKGIYFAKVTTENASATVKLIKN